jgi:hypothetical protein
VTEIKKGTGTANLDLSMTLSGIMAPMDNIIDNLNDMSVSVTGKNSIDFFKTGMSSPEMSKRNLFPLSAEKDHRTWHQIQPNEIKRVFDQKGSIEKK